MNPELAALHVWIQGCLWIAAICTTAFPVLYMFSPWYGSPLGRVLMIQSIAFSVAMDLTLLFQYWTPASVYVLFWTNAFVLTFIAYASASMTFHLWKSNYKHRQWIKESLKR